MNQPHPNPLSHSTWRPPYPSENLKTPRFAQTKTYSTTNPYATQEDENQIQNQHQGQEPSLNQLHSDQHHSKRENNSNKIYERGLTPQVGMNPFLKDSNYLQDLETQNEFLKPINTNGLSSNKTI
jgi:hypothetical protein